MLLAELIINNPNGKYGSTSSSLNFSRSTSYISWRSI